MSGNSFGRLFVFTSFGESHSDAIGGVIEGFPSGVELDFDFIASELNRRRPQSRYSTPRTEEDYPQFLCGLENGITLGTPLAFILKNTNAQKADYSNLSNLFRPSHGDYTYYCKYGINASSGGGRASARETAARVVAGALAKLYLKGFNITITSKIEQVGGEDYINCRKQAEDKLQEALAKGDSLGGVISCTIDNVPAGLGEPVFAKLSAALAYAQMSIPSAKSFEIGDGLESCKRFGSQDIDQWKQGGGTLSNHSGGIQGGISNGEQIIFKTGFKPAASIKTMICKDHDNRLYTIENKGRHDIAPILRAGVVVEAMAALVIADFIKMQQTNKKI